MARAQILVAASDQGFANGLAANLKSLGYAVVEVVSTPEEALEKAENTRPNLILLDLEWVRKGKKSKAARQLRKLFPQGLLYLAADDDRQTLEQAEIAHSFDYLRKACDSRELETIIDMALFRQELEGESKQQREGLRLSRQKWHQRDEEKAAKIGKITTKLKTETARHQELEVALQAERQKLYQVLDTLPTYVVLLTPEHDVPFANREFIKRFGAPEGRKCYDFLFNRTSPCPQCETYKVLDTNAPHEWDWTGPDGRDYQIYDFPFKDSDGSSLILEMGVDVTVLTEKESQIRKMAADLQKSYEEMEARVQDRTQELATSNAALQMEIAERLWSEKKLKESEERYRLLVDLSPDAIAVYSRGRLVFINPAGVQLFGAADSREIMEKPALDLIHPEYRETVTQRLRRLTTEGGRTKLREIKIQRLNGQELDVEASAVGITYQGEPAVQVMLRDISRRKDMEKKLEHLASFPRLNPNPVLEADDSWNITYANEATFKVLERLGWEKRTRLFLPPDRNHILKAARETGETVFRREVEVNGSFFSETISFAPELNVFHIYTTDITARKRAEMERQDLLEKLQVSEEELQATVEELQVQAEELQSQTEELQKINHNLQEAHDILQEREAQLQTIFDSLTEGLVVADLQGRLVHWNPAAVAMHGFATLSECQCRLPEFADIFELSTPEDGILPLIEWPLSRILRGETLHDWEVKVHRLGTGWQRVFRYGGRLARDRHGQPLLAVVTVSDVTEHLQAEEALLESRKDLNRAQAVAHTGSWRLDVRKNELTWSDENHRIFGIPRGRPLTYEAFLANVHPDDRAYVDREWTSALRGEPYDIEHRIVVGDEVKWVRERAELEFGPQGQILGGFGTTQDITARKEWEKALQESEARYRNLFQSNQAVMLLIDPATGEIVDANPAACSFYGSSHKDLTGKKITDINLMPPEQIFRKMRQIQEGTESHFFFQHLLASGEVRDVEVYSSPLQVHGRVLLYSIIHDNTGRKKAEETLKTSRDFLDIANRHTQMSPLLQDFAAAVQEHTGCEAVAIRILDDQGNIPYVAYSGFQDDFIACESPLSILSDRCLCINVIKRETDPALPCYTPGSSCYINQFSHLLTSTPGGVLGETRNVCQKFGYESVALVPIVFGGSILGLIHLADRRENMMPLSLVERLERIALTLGTAINRVRAEEGLRQALTDSRRRQAEIAALLEATRAVLAAGDFQDIARSIYDSCKDLIGASAGYIALLTPDGQESEVLFLDTGKRSCLVDPSLPMPVRGLRAEAYRTCKTLYDNDYPCSDHTRFLPLGHVTLDNVLFSPLVMRGRAAGLLGLGNKPGGYDENDARLAGGFAELAAVALGNKRAEEERERLIRELETERARLQAIISSAPEAIVVADEHGHVLLTNPAADRLYSHPEGCVPDAPGCALFQFCQADGTACVPGDQPLLRSAREGETHRNVEMVLAWPDGPRRDLLVNTAPITDHQGRSSGAVGLFQDITQRKQAEEKIRKLNAELSERIQEVSERTLQLEAANKELEAFSYSVSHDLRTPLRAIEGFARMLLEDYAARLDEEGLRLLEVIRSNTRIMAELIDDLLALSRLGRQEIRHQDIDLGGLVTSVFGEIRTQEPSRQLELVLNPLLPAYGDRSLINQVLVNLLGNAVKFTKPKGKAIIEVGGWTEGKENIYFIKDNGVGFDMRYVGKIFGVFQRLHRREDFEGTGVGLAIVQRIINRHGGRVWATGKVDNGAVFYFSLPRKGV